MNNSKTPLYFQVYEDIKTRIVNGEYEEGTKLPSERKLCDLYDVSRITIRESLDRLEQEQMIRREHGKGSIVLGNHYTQVLNSLYSFKDEIEKNGKQASTKVISMERIDATPFLQEKMGLKSFHSVYRLIRLRLANEQPMIYEITYLPVRLCEGLDKFDFNHHSLYETLDQYYDIQIDNAYESLSAIKLNKSIADLLNESINASCMFIERVSYVKGEIIEYTQSYAGGNNYKYTVQLL